MFAVDDIVWRAVLQKPAVGGSRGGSYGGRSRSSSRISDMTSRNYAEYVMTSIHYTGRRLNEDREEKIEGIRRGIVREMNYRYKLMNLFV